MASRTVANGEPTNDLVLSASVNNNGLVFPQILDLYVSEGSRVADVTYGKGAFWRHVSPNRYEVLATDLATGVDCRNLPYSDRSIDCVVLDPPYMHSPGGTAHRTHAAFETYYRNNQTDGGGSKYHEAVVDLYADAGAEAYRVLRDRGVIIVKCQDEVCSNRQRLTHVEIIQHYESLGFVLEDLFVVVRTNSPGVSRAVKQVHARKNHSYFLVFWKPGQKGKIWEPPMTAIELMREVIEAHSPPTKWTGAPLEGFRHVANTNRGEIGEEFVFRYLRLFGVDIHRRGSRITNTDLRIGDHLIEVKTASEDVGGNFQFNHIRYDREYAYLLCLAISPAGITFGIWSKGEVAEGRAGRLVRMAEGQSVTFKLTKRLDQMIPIESLPATIRRIADTAPEESHERRSR